MRYFLSDNYSKLALYFSALMLLFLLAISIFHKMGNFGVETDFYWSYAPDAERIIHGHNTLEPGVGPVYPLLLGVMNLVFHDYFISGKMLSIISTVLAGLFIFKLIQSLFDGRLAFFTMVLFYATVLPFSIIAGTDMFFTCLFAASIYVFFRGSEINNLNLILSGIFMGLTFLTRHNGVILPVCTGLILLFVNPDNWSWVERIKRFSLFFSVFLLVNLPWGLVQLMASGNAVRSDSYLIIASNFYGKSGVVSSEDMRLATQKFDSLRSVIFFNFPHFVKHYFSNIYHHFYDFLIESLKFPSFLFVGAGALLLIPKMNKKQLSLFIFPVLSFLLLCLVHYEPRYYLYLIFFFVLFVAYFIFGDHFQSNTGNPIAANYLMPVVFVVTIMFLSVFSTKEIRRNISEEPRELLEISQILKDKILPNQSIIARKPHLGYLTHLKTVYFPESKSVSDLLNFAKKEKADYLIYGTEEFKRRPALKDLLEPEKTPAEMEAIIVWKNPKTIIYKFNFSQSVNSG